MTANDVRSQAGNDADAHGTSGGGELVDGPAPGNRAKRPLSNQSCPPWCMEAHIDEHPGERIHNAWIRAVDLNALPLPGPPQQLWLDLFLGPGDKDPRVHVQIDDRFIAELTVAEARAIGTHLIGMAALGVMEIPPTSPA
ncbi:DUF6907 domain-containing protein [Sphaerimonospora thailandensis]|uniref:Uncharacterized protein n=1 Tax=Sphaerimonospora thailandensis TaxID=795644 RepID=A0A8J3W154_9ACTN|nr:hypothetical protein [Sphaerimonospora thailandensis]GIH71446.1 hypothetical protein Mth01_36990 [Sphaerimonospora thailandensis]